VSSETPTNVPTSVRARLKNKADELGLAFDQVHAARHGRPARAGHDDDDDDEEEGVHVRIDSGGMRSGSVPPPRAISVPCAPETA